MGQKEKAKPKPVYVVKVNYKSTTADERKKNCTECVNKLVNQRLRKAA